MSDSVSLFLRDLSHLDCAFLDAAQGLTGESWSVDVQLSGPLDDGGMICDFGVVKQVIKTQLDAAVDHRLLLFRQDDVDCQREAGQLELIHSDRSGRRLRYRAPEEAICELDIPGADPASLAQALADLVRPLLPDSIETLELSLRQERQRGQFAYCHGLQHHGGNCQRMGHGHRGRFSIALDGLAAPWLESHWAQRLGGRYIGSESHLQSAAGIGRLHFAYTGSQGHFELELGEDRAYVLPGVATVECLASHVAERIAREHPDQAVQVSAYEGIGKGAVARRGP